MVTSATIITLNFGHCVRFQMQLKPIVAMLHLPAELRRVVFLVDLGEVHFCRSLPGTVSSSNVAVSGTEKLLEVVFAEAEFRWRRRCFVSVTWLRLDVLSFAVLLDEKPTETLSSPKPTPINARSTDCDPGDHSHANSECPEAEPAEENNIPRTNFHQHQPSHKADR